MVRANDARRTARATRDRDARARAAGDDCAERTNARRRATTRRRRRDAGLTTARARERAQSSFVKAGSYDPTLVDVELTAEEAKTRANRRDAFREHLRATLAEKELVGAFAKSCIG